MVWTLENKIGRSIRSLVLDFEIVSWIAKPALCLAIASQKESGLYSKLKAEGVRYEINATC